MSFVSASQSLLLGLQMIRNALSLPPLLQGVPKKVSFRNLAMIRLKKNIRHFNYHITSSRKIFLKHPVVTAVKIISRIMNISL